MATPTFVPADFVPPARLDHERFHLVPLGVDHNESDYTAWTSSMDHIRATPGFEAGTWPVPMTLEENRGDLARHAADFAARTGFTYTALAPDGETVIGCVYIYPTKDGTHAASVRSWVRATDADLDPVLHRVVSAWLEADWPFARVDYAARLPGDSER